MKFKNIIKKKSSTETTKYRSNKCLNCGHPLQLSDLFCSYCSQKNSTQKLTIKLFFEEFLSTIFSYDSRFQKTLSALIFKPGKITKDYVSGKRKTYANPFRFYLSVSIIFFIIWGAINRLDEWDFTNKGDFISYNLGKENVKKIINDSTFIKNNIVKLDSMVAKESGKPFSIDSIKSENINQKISIDSVLKQQIQKDSVKESYKNLYIKEDSLNKLGFFKNFGYRFILYQKFNKETKIKRSKTALDSLKHNKTRYHKWLYKKASATNDMDQIGPLIAYFVKQLPFIIFFFLPIFAVFVWFFYIRRNFSYTDHLIFLFHTQTMFFVLFGVGIILDKILSTDMVTSIMSLLFLLYLYKAMRTFYRQGRLKTIVKFFILNTIFFILAMVGAVFSFAVSFATY
ncbi:MAG: DUF3667 domain-containing protein [Flavobacteriales bacterium]